MWAITLQGDGWQAVKPYNSQFEFSDCSNKIWTCNLLWNRARCYHTNNKTTVKDKILKLTPIYTSVTYQIPWIHWIQRRFGSIITLWGKWSLNCNKLTKHFLQQLLMTDEGLKFQSPNLDWHGSQKFALILQGACILRNGLQDKQVSVSNTSWLAVVTFKM